MNRRMIRLAGGKFGEGLRAWTPSMGAGGGRCRGATEAGMNVTPAPAALWGDGHDQARPPSDFAGDEGLAWLWMDW